MRNISAKGLALIKSFEAFNSKPYQDVGGVWTIGYGHTQDVTAATDPINEIQASALLFMDLAHAQSQVGRYIDVTLNDNQYAALVSLVYNVGNAPLERTLGLLLNAGNYKGAANEFTQWIFVKGEISEGLIRRRIAEKSLFLADDSCAA